MKRKGKIWFVVVTILILLLSVTTLFGYSNRYGDTVTPIIKGVDEIRFGIDIRGGVDVSFVPADGTEATDSQMSAAQAVIEQRLMGLGITDYEIYKDVDKSRIILRFPWKVGETEFNPEAAIQELAATAMLTFREGAETDEETGAPTGVTEENIILQGTDVTEAKAQYARISEYDQPEHYVSLTLSPEGATKFAEATGRLAQEENGMISIWMDDQMISAPTVNEQISGGQAMISGDFDAESAQALADKINAGSLPFALQADSFSTISPTLGSHSLRAMTIAGIVAFIFIICFMIFLYKVPGIVASIALLGQAAGMLAFVSGYFSVFNSFTLTLPGIAGIILSIGMGVDANVITSERIKEELRSGKKLDASIRSGFKRGLAPVIDGNVTVLIVAAILMGAFGPSDNIFALILRPIFFAFGPSTAGTIYSFGYTLFIGVILNFIFGIIGTRIMLISLSKFKGMRKPSWYGGLKEGKPTPAPVSLNIVKNRKKFFTFSTALLAAIVACTFLLGVQLDVQFSGGAIITYSHQGEIDLTETQTLVDEAVGDGATLQEGDDTASGGKTLTITLPGTKTVEASALESLTASLQETYPNANVEQLEVNNVDATIGNAFLMKCLVAVLAASVLILVYIAIRFRNIGGWLGGFTAIVALLHDLALIYGVFVVLQIPLNGNFIAALLTILGYSINDTVVIYDRVRENRALYGKKLSFSELMNRSINQSMKRSVNTTITTVAALGCVCIFAVVYNLDSIFTFAFPMMIGMITGAYSTICIAGPLWVTLLGRKDKKTGHGKTEEKAGKKAEEKKDKKEQVPSEEKQEERPKNEVEKETEKEEGETSKEEKNTESEPSEKNSGKKDKKSGKKKLQENPG
ncbi:protein translocase subunit SecF [Ruminococcaceae bacterium OttesenSCG-928-I18]|nr:protein translocase subunit SecF [Ruminococcaceae bacterium OttesenSCG-928-I18]